MRALSVVAVVAVLLSGFSQPATAQDCGGDNPRWILVTLMEIRSFSLSTGEITVRSGRLQLLKICDILEIGTNSLGETLISLKSDVPSDEYLNRSWWVKETPTQLCSALPSCVDATVAGEPTDGPGSR